MAAPAQGSVAYLYFPSDAHVGSHYRWFQGRILQSSPRTALSLLAVQCEHVHACLVGGGYMEYDVAVIHHARQRVLVAQRCVLTGGVMAQLAARADGSAVQERLSFTPSSVLCAGTDEFESLRARAFADSEAAGGEEGVIVTGVAQLHASDDDPAWRDMRATSGEGCSLQSMLARTWSDEHDSEVRDAETGSSAAPAVREGGAWMRAGHRRREE